MTGSNQVSNVVSSVVTPVALSGVKTPLLNQFEGAAAAYSLRRLKSWDDGSRVVRVRRESDNTERDFSSVEVSDGTMARWVNEQPTLPLDLRELDTNTGERDGALIEAAAAYSLRKLKEDFTGDVVEVRRNVDGETEGFTAAEVTDGTLESFVNASFDDELPLDQATGAAAAYSLRNLSSSGTDVTTSGDTAGDTTGKYVVQVRRSIDDEVKSFTASEVADGTLEDWVNVGNDYVGYARFQDSSTANVDLSSSFTLEATNSWSIKFGYIGGESITGLFGNSAFSNGGFWFANPTTIGLTDDSDTYQELWFGSGLALNIGQHYEIEFFNTPSEGIRVKVDGTTMSTTPKIYGDITIDRIGLSRSRDGERVIHNVRVDLNGDGTLDYSYAGDGNQSSNWVDRVGSNNGTPTAQVLTYDNDYTDGYVKTWYDQSGSDNHAVQTDTAKQPKIVEGGAILDGINIDATNENLVLPNTSTLGISGSSDRTVMAVMNSEGVDDGFMPLGGWNGTDASENYFKNYRLRAAASDGTARVEVAGYNTPSSVDVSDGNKHLMSSILSGTTTADLDISGDGTISAGSGTDTIDTGDFPLYVGFIPNRTQVGFGSVQEIIIYPSDQSTKRRAIEENIANHYDITLAAFSRDGTVKTWYDQSGNTNDAVQTDATKQPKIVNSGTLVTGGIRFDDNQLLETTNTFTYGSGTTLSTFITNSSDGDESAYLFRFASDYIIYNTGGGGRRVFAGTNTDAGNVTGDEELWTTISELNTAGGTSNFYVDGTLESAADAAIGTNTVSNRVLNIGGSGASTHWNGTVNEVILYDTDQTDNRTAIEANIGETYNITAIPAANDTVNGYVQTWYDQSGSGNDAEQSAASSQPKIVGEVTSGQPHAFLGAIEFDGSQQFQTITLTSSSQPNSIFSVSNTNVAGQTRGIYGTNANQASYYRSSNKHAIYSSGTGAGTLEGSAYVVDTDYLRFDLFNGANSVIGVNGTTTSGTTGDAVLNRLDIGDASLGGVNPLNGGIKELILYTDDQSSNRPAIEANIANQYGITLS